MQQKNVTKNVTTQVVRFTVHGWFLNFFIAISPLTIVSATILRNSWHIVIKNSFFKLLWWILRFWATNVSL